MKNFSWLLAIILLIASCTGTEEIAPDPAAVKTDPAANVAASNGSNARVASGPYSKTYPSQTISFSDTQGTFSYVITPSVTWSGSSTTWTYDVKGVNGSFNVRDISHVTFLGLSSCLSDLKPSITTTSGSVELDAHEGNTGCMDKDTEVLKIDGVTVPSLTITFTYSKALEVNPAAASLFVKTAQDCDKVSIPGPSCNTLGLKGNITELYCEDVTSSTHNLSGTVVTATQGAASMTTTTDANGNYSLDNLGGIWDIASVNQTASVTLGELGDVSGVNFVSDVRPNNSCAEIIGSVERFDCDGTASQHSVEGEVTLSGVDYSATTTASNGEYTFSNVPEGNYTVTYANVSQAVSVASTSGSTDLDFSVDNRINHSCATITGHVDLEQCVNQNSTSAPVAGARVTAVSENSTLTGTTDASGNFTFSNVSNGTYTVTVAGIDGSNFEFHGSQTAEVANSEGLSTLAYAFDTRPNGACGDQTICSLSQGYWFAKPQTIWPNDGTLTLGGKVYTQTEGKAIWNTTNKGGMLNAKQAFTQAAAIKLSGVIAGASVWSDVAIIDAYFATLTTKMSATAIPKNSTLNAAAGAAAGRIGTWIAENHCNETN